MRLLPRSFCARDAVDVAVALLGRYLVLDDIVLRITETEAYRWPGDTACHGRSGLTARNAALWGPPGRAYVYLCYGLHNMLNVVTGREGEAAAVLIRACEVVAGREQIEVRRRRAHAPDLLAGPGKVGQALGLDPSWSHHPLYEPGGLVITRGRPPSSVLVGARVGIDYALPEHRALPWRFAAADSEAVTHRRGLRPDR